MRIFHFWPFWKKWLFGPFFLKISNFSNNLFLLLYLRLSHKKAKKFNKSLDLLWLHYNQLGDPIQLSGTGLKNIVLKRRISFCFEKHTSVIIKNLKTEKSNGGFLKKMNFNGCSFFLKSRIFNIFIIFFIFYDKKLIPNKKVFL